MNHSHRRPSDPTVLGIPFAIVLGLIAGVFNFIPNLGPYLAMAPALLVAFPQGLTQPLYVAALYMGIQSLEGYILTPLLDKKFVSLPPALLLFGQVLLGLLVGLVGILFASPLIAVLLVIVQELYVKDRLENRELGYSLSLFNTHDPYPVRVDDVGYEIDLGAEMLIAAQKDSIKIAVEIKSFVGPSTINEFHKAVGQFNDYYVALSIQEPERVLYLAVPESIWNRFFQKYVIQKSLERIGAKVLVYNPNQNKIVTWKS